MKRYVWTWVIATCLLCATVAAETDQASPNLSYTDARIFNNNGVEFVAQAKYEEAAREFQKSIAVDPDFHIARYNLALAYYNLGRVKEAISELEYLVNSSYYFVNARYNLGTVYLREGMTDKAIEQLKIVVELEPAHAEAHFNLGFIYFKKDKLDEAIAEYQKALQIKPDTIRGHLSLAFIYEKKRQDKEAIEEYSTAVRLKPDDEDARQALGGLQAIVHIKETLRATPNDPSAYINIGHIYYARGMYSEAADSYSKALHYDPQNNIAKSSADKAVIQLLAQEDRQDTAKHPKGPAS